MTIIEAMIQLRNDLKLWVTNNLRVKMDKNLGTDNAGKVLAIDGEGDIIASDKTLEDIKETFVITVDENGIADKTYKEIFNEVNSLSSNNKEIILQRYINSDNINGMTLEGYEYYKYSGREQTGEEGNASSNLIHHIFYTLRDDKLFQCDISISIKDISEDDESYNEFAIPTFSSIDVGDVDLSGYYTKTEVDTSLSNKMNKTNPTGTGSFSLNRKAGSEIGNYSVAEGYNTEASAQFSHAEGYNTETSGMRSHAEGYNTLAMGENQHVQGAYNAKDTLGKYAHIVGNGTAENARSNAHTLDWQGNAWYAGEVYVGGTGQNDSTAEKLVKSSELSTKLDKNQGASNVGKVLLVDTDGSVVVGNPTIEGAVDEAAKLTTPRNIALAGDVTGNAYFDGSTDIEINTTVSGLADFNFDVSNGSLEIIDDPELVGEGKESILARFDENGLEITNVIINKEPTENNHAVTKGYVDDKVSSKIVVSSNEPTSPIEGLIWIDTSTETIISAEGASF